MGPRMAGDLTSAARLESRLARALCDVHDGELFSNGGVDAHRVIEILLCRPHLHSHGKALRDLPSIGAHIVQAHDALTVGQVNHELAIALVVLPNGHPALAASSALLPCLTTTLPR